MSSSRQAKGSDSTQLPLDGIEGSMGTEANEMFSYSDGFTLAPLGRQLPPQSQSAAKYRLDRQRAMAKANQESDGDEVSESSTNRAAYGGRPRRKSSTQHIMPMATTMGAFMSSDRQFEPGKDPLALSEKADGVGRKRHRLTAAAVTLLDAFEDKEQPSEVDRAMAFMSGSLGPQSIREGSRKYASSVQTKDSLSLLVDGSASNLQQKSDSNVLPLPIVVNGLDEVGPPECSHTQTAPPLVNNQTLPVKSQQSASRLVHPSILLHPSTLSKTGNLRNAFFVGHPSRPRMRFNEAVATARQMRRMAGSNSMSISVSDVKGREGANYTNPNAGVGDVLPMPIVGPPGESSSSGSNLEKIMEDSPLPPFRHRDDASHGSTLTYTTLPIARRKDSYGDSHRGSLGPKGDNRSDTTGTTVSARSSGAGSGRVHPGLLTQGYLAYPTMQVSSNYAITSNAPPTDCFATSFNAALPPGLPGAADSFSYHKAGFSSFGVPVLPSAPTDLLGSMVKAPPLHNQIFRRRSSSVPLKHSIGRSFNANVSQNYSRNPSISMPTPSLLKEDEPNFPNVSPFSVRAAPSERDDISGGGDFIGCYNMQGVVFSGNDGVAIGGSKAVAAGTGPYALLVTPVISASDPLGRSGPAQAFHGDEQGGSMIGSIVAMGGASDAKIYGAAGASFMSPSSVRPLEGGGMGTSMAYSFHGTSMSSLAHNNPTTLMGSRGGPKLLLPNDPMPSTPQEGGDNTATKGAKALLLDGLTHLMQQKGPSEAVTPRKRRPRALSIDSVTDFLASFVPLGCSEMSGIGAHPSRNKHLHSNISRRGDRTPSPLASLHSPPMNINEPRVGGFEMSLMTPLHATLSPATSLISTPMAHPAIGKRQPRFPITTTTSFRMPSMDRQSSAQAVTTPPTANCQDPLSPPRSGGFGESWMAQPHTMVSPKFNLPHPRKNSAFGFNAEESFLIHLNGQAADDSPQGITGGNSNTANNGASKYQVQGRDGLVSLVQGESSDSPASATRTILPSNSVAEATGVPPPLDAEDAS